MRRRRPQSRSERERILMQWVEGSKEERMAVLMEYIRLKETEPEEQPDPANEKTSPG